MRLFLTIEIPKEIRDKLFDIQKEFGKDVLSTKWVAKKHIHLTLKFLGEVNSILMKKTIEELEKVKFKEFSLQVGKAGFFQRKGLISVVFIDLENSKELHYLKDDIEIGLLEIFPRDDSFEAHVTLGRVKKVFDKDKFVDVIDKIKINDKFEVKEFVLMQSMLTKDGPIYSVVKRF